MKLNIYKNSYYESDIVTDQTLDYKSTDQYGKIICIIVNNKNVC